MANSTQSRTAWTVAYYRRGVWYPTLIATTESQARASACDEIVAGRHAVAYPRGEDLPSSPPPTEWPSNAEIEAARRAREIYRRAVA